MALDVAHLPKEAQAEGESPADHHAAFTVLADLDSDGEPERALVGVYETHSGKRGRFLLVLTRRAGQWTKQALFETEGESGFSFLSWSGDQLVWSQCMECDVVCTLALKESTLSLDCSACEDCA